MILICADYEGKVTSGIPVRDCLETKTVEGTLAGENVQVSTYGYFTRFHAEVGSIYQFNLKTRRLERLYQAKGAAAPELPGKLLAILERLADDGE